MKKRNWFQKLFFKPTLEQIVFENNSPKDVCRTVARWIVYKEEPVDQWSLPAVILDREYGDCEDFAVLIQYICFENGWDSNIILYYSILNPTYGHAILTGQLNENLWMSSNGSYDVIESLEDINSEASIILRCKPSQLFNVPLSKEEVDRLVDASGRVQKRLVPVA